MNDESVDFLNRLWAVLGKKGIEYFMNHATSTEEDRIEARRQLKLQGYVALQDETIEQRQEREAEEAMIDKWISTPTEDMVAYLNYPLATPEGISATVRQMSLRGYKPVLMDDVRPAVCSELAE